MQKDFFFLKYIRIEQKLGQIFQNCSTLIKPQAICMWRYNFRSDAPKLFICICLYNILVHLRIIAIISLINIKYPYLKTRNLGLKYFKIALPNLVSVPLYPTVPCIKKFQKIIRLPIFNALITYA